MSKSRHNKVILATLGLTLAPAIRTAFYPDGFWIAAGIVIITYLVIRGIASLIPEKPPIAK